MVIGTDTNNSELERDIVNVFSWFATGERAYDKDDSLLRRDSACVVTGFKGSFIRESLVNVGSLVTAFDCRAFHRVETVQNPSP